jgi:signal transduction histidine kinase
MLDWTPKRRAWLRACVPASLQGRIVLLMTFSVIAAQLVGVALWSAQIRSTAFADAKVAAHNMAFNAAGSLRFFADLPAEFRPILIEQLRTMGGTRFFVNINRAEVPLVPIYNSELADIVTNEIREELPRAAPFIQTFRVVFASPEGLQVSDDGRRVEDLPKDWVEATLLLKPRPAPVLVIQAEYRPGDWLYLAATMPDPYFLDNASPMSLNLVAMQLLILLAVLAITVIVVRTLIRPLNRIAKAANAFVANGGEPERLPETGSNELRRTAQAFNAMQARIQSYIIDRERLFVAISHSLKTPIMRLKLRTEMLDDASTRADFHEDLDDLDLMVKSALQSVRDSDIHENREPVKLHLLLDRLAKRPIYPNAQICLSLAPCVVNAKRLALTRAFGNLLDNAILYGQHAELTLRVDGGVALITIRDFGPGIAPQSMQQAFEPHVRLAHGHQSNRAGSGLGLGLARSIVQAHGGTVALSNHDEGGLIVTVSLPISGKTEAAAHSPP